MDTSKSYQFIVPNIADNDVTLSELKGTNSRFDISKGDMRFQFTIPTDDLKDQKMFQFKAVDRSLAVDLSTALNWNIFRSERPENVPIQSSR